MKELKDIKQAYDESSQILDPLYTQMEDDYKMALGNQLSSEDKDSLVRGKRPYVVINHLLKPCKLITGYQKQSRSDIRVLPIEGGDIAKADLYTQALKWIMTNSGGYYYVSTAFENAVVGGIGWITCDINYDNDPYNGDIVIKSENPFRMFFDPFMKDADLSDCSYIIRRAYLQKGQAKALYPKVAKDIDKMKTADIDAKFQRQTPFYKGSARDYVAITEMWYREFEEREFAAIPSEDGSFRIIEIGEAEREQVQMAKAQGVPIDIIVRKVPRIKLITGCNEEVELYNGESPYKVNQYPFFPLFGYYTPDFNDWEWKVQGIVRALKDNQKEINKMRSNFMEAVMRSPFSGIMYEEGAINDETQFDKPGPGRKLKLNPGAISGNKIKDINPPPVQPALMQLGQMAVEDIRQVGPNPDMLGIMQDKGAPGVTIQLRQKQGITSIQDMFDNLSYAQRNLGRYLIEAMNANWKPFKFTRILGNDVIVPPDFAERAGCDRYDCIVDEVSNSPSYRIASAMMIQQLMSTGMVPPEKTGALFDAFVKLSDIPAGIKETLLTPPPPPMPPGGPQGPEMPGQVPVGPPPPPEQMPEGAY